ncbi:unknown protein [Arabidopsis thaliana]|jgi:outer membrane biosynthesis protein TonB|uniref:Heavy metal-associated isoprenylated plant protein 16 n=3 Tax=Arabidopsis TaxID=3701 RepID=HIP16_ARATH|nr:Heavy metal transport/detoxification superfamily protein [Arabidopsis thaliana]Q9SSF0.1 RecName: Full=Heavy metal-associated isoprenylated plant protein 16; Short=AtHIP16; AltName: Full=Farnesylated protein 4; Short=AtFP4; Flags: Precursor [Arabidopsis thaliana]KAG7630434.1 hypothetical protein ISN44_As03g007680 [Arabidopsis suecica]AAF13078.1 unknown protein [Arabidopsis thaliana]AEE74572.1 Heavy metal transport/detoxification superfamily protein [Arabidopsis thaliana]CAA0381688.1 unnamed |eukprot:NP_187417.1 Heavy metal transport/detoxification superfamily protein [Arabidopsis thaliana]
MKQKILIRIAMTDDTTRAKAMKTAVQFKGVNAVEIKGDHRNQIEVTGVEVDMIALINTLRKKVAFAELVSVAKVEPPKDGDKKPEEEKKPEEKKPEEKKPEEKKPEPCCQPWQKPEPCYQPWPHDGYGVPSSYPYPCDPYNQIGEPVYNQDPNCRIM